MMIDLNEYFDERSAQLDALLEKHPRRTMHFHVNLDLGQGIWIERFQEGKNCEYTYEDFVGFDIDEVLGEFTVFLKKQWELYLKSRKQERRPRATGVDNLDVQEYVDKSRIQLGMKLIFH
jgi:hypothetical protein